MSNPQMYILRWGVNPSHLCNDSIVYGYRNACDAYQSKREDSQTEFNCVVLVKLNFDQHGFVYSRDVKMSTGLNTEQVQLVQDGKL